MREIIEVGSASCDEPCVQLGCEDYELLARAECRRFILAIRAALGPEPEGCRLAVRSSPHDYGRYYEVVAVVDDSSDVVAMDYAYRCESEAPTRWPAEVPA